jgi:hypothetical protein
VLALLVATEVHLALEALAAEVASEWFESRVFPAVRYEVGTLAESFPAHLAFMRLLPWKKEIKKNH